MFAIIHRRQNKELDIKVFVTLDPDSRLTEIAANEVLLAVTRNSRTIACIGGSTWYKIDSSAAPKYSKTEFTVLRGGWSM